MIEWPRLRRSLHLTATFCRRTCRMLGRIAPPRASKDYQNRNIEMHYCRLERSTAARTSRPWRCRLQMRAPLAAALFDFHCIRPISPRSGQHRPRRRRADGTGCRAAGARDKCGGSMLIEGSPADGAAALAPGAVAPAKLDSEIADLPQDLSPWSMLHADIIVKAVDDRIGYCLARHLDGFGLPRASSSSARAPRCGAVCAFFWIPRRWRERMSSFAMRRDRSRT